MGTLKDTKFVTDLEKKVIENIINSEYMDAIGLCVCDISEGDETCSLTTEGYAWAKSNTLCD